MNWGPCSCVHIMQQLLYIFPMFLICVFGFSCIQIQDFTPLSLSHFGVTLSLRKALAVSSTNEVYATNFFKRCHKTGPIPVIHWGSLFLGILWRVQSPMVLSTITTDLASLIMHLRWCGVKRESLPVYSPSQFFSILQKVLINATWGSGGLRHLSLINITNEKFKPVSVIRRNPSKTYEQKTACLQLDDHSKHRTG